MSLEATVYVKMGDRIVLRSALPATHPESWISLWKSEYGSLEDFPWKDVFGTEPTKKDLVKMGIHECPFCGEKLE